MGVLAEKNSPRFRYSWKPLAMRTNNRPWPILGFSRKKFLKSTIWSCEKIRPIPCCLNNFKVVSCEYIQVPVVAPSFFVKESNMRGKELVKLLEKYGWVLDRISGSHHIMVKVRKASGSHFCTWQERPE